MYLKHIMCILISKFFLNTALTRSDFYESEYKSCICVPYWQCKEDFSGLKYGTVELMDVRLSEKFGNPVNGVCNGDFDVCCRVECGRRYMDATIKYEGGHFDVSTLTPRIYKGNDAKFAEFPWMLALMREKTYKCGASLIHPQVAITAAHCVDEFGIFKVRAGEYNWRNEKETLPHQDRIVKKVILHPQYNPQSLTNDIALLILDSPFLLTQNVGIICLPLSAFLRNTTKCTVSGWGRNSWKKGTYSDTLKKIDISLVPRNQCLQELRKAKLGKQFHLHRSFLCAGDGSKDACKGDGGSPLFCEVEGENSRYEQVGIVSWGLTCGLFETPGVYVNVGLFVNWIDAQMESHQFDKNIYKY